MKKGKALINANNIKFNELAKEKLLNQERRIERMRENKC